MGKTQRKFKQSYWRSQQKPRLMELSLWISLELFSGHKIGKACRPKALVYLYMIERVQWTAWNVHWMLDYYLEADVQCKGLLIEYAPRTYIASERYWRCRHWHVPFLPYVCFPVSVFLVLHQRVHLFSLMLPRCSSSFIVCKFVIVSCCTVCYVARSRMSYRRIFEAHQTMDTQYRGSCMAFAIFLAW